MKFGVKNLKAHSNKATETPPLLATLLAHEIRWGLVQALRQGDFRVQELAAGLNQPMNLVSYHLKLLRDQQVLIAQRSEADRRDIYYRLDWARLEFLYQELGGALFRESATESAAMRRVLFLCTANSARSQMAEGFLNEFGGGQVVAASAGSHPAPVHPAAVAIMQRNGIDISGKRSKAVEQFLAQAFDYVITVCDRMRENCPAFPHATHLLHWSIPDPAAAVQSEQRAVFEATAAEIAARVRYFLRTMR